MLYKKHNHKKIVAIGDIHGNYNTLKALLEKIPKGIDIYFLGDLIDRGKRSKEVVELVKTKYKSVLGNHDSFMAIEGQQKLKHYGSTWRKNGAKDTKRSYGGDWQIKTNPKQRKIYRDHIFWMKSLPLVAHFPKIKIDGRELFLSHSSMDSAISKLGLKGLIKVLKREENFLSGYTGGDNFKALDSIFWKIEGEERIKDHGIFNVFGHTIDDEVRIKKHYACIDTGVCQPHKLSAIVLPSMEIIEQEYIPDTWGHKK